ncbi:hypothetical protein pEaSNUABM9_00040 [Erwinia phage pEa_SNUABM_9]|nr:hypothetical protein pEaSNUABM9_00040 [Erwinia phage pEa_SNUABM_9]
MLEKFITLDEVVPSLDSVKRRVLRDHTEYLRNHKDTQTIPLDPRFAWPEIHNFYAYCKLVGWEPNQVYPIMLINRIDEPMMFNTDDFQTLRVPTSMAVAEVLETIIS